MKEKGAADRQTCYAVGRTLDTALLGPAQRQHANAVTELGPNDELVSYSATHVRCDSEETTCRDGENAHVI